MCKILLSINPEHVENIFNGKKEFEYRKTVCKKPIDKIVIYSTSPVKKIVGEADVEKTIIDEPKKIWSQTKNVSGINREFFDLYYKGKKKAVAFKLTNVLKYERPLLLSEIGVKVAPQSYIYLD